MEIKRHILFILFTILFSSGSWTQTGRYTNVDTNYLTPKWVLEPLSVTKYRNGKSLEICKEIYKFYYLNKPACLIKNINGQDIYFYNQTSIIPSNGDTLAPRGYRIATEKDYAKIMNTPNNFLHGSKMTGYIDFSYYDLGDFKYIWTSDELGKEKGLAVKITSEDEIYFDEIPFDYGCQVYCIENIEETIQDSIYIYKKLLPNEYKKLLENLYVSVSDNYNFLDKDIIAFNGQISVLRDGSFNSNISSDITINGNAIRNNELIKLNLKNILTNATIPYYHGQIVQSKSLIDLKIEYNEKLSSKLEFYKSKLKKIDATSKSNLERADSFGFTCTNKDETIIFIENGLVLNIKKTTFVNNFKAKGPLYSTLCFIPGLGLSQITKDNFNSNKRSNFKKFLLSTSISLGAISIGSKIASTIYYKRYKSDLFGNTAATNYKTANTFQKIFLTTGYGYCVLGAIDFTWTFSIGCKNKVTQHRLNEAIKKDPSNFILK